MKCKFCGKDMKSRGGIVGNGKCKTIHWVCWSCDYEIEEIECEIESQKLISL